MCDIVDLRNPDVVYYEWSPLTAFKPVQLYDENIQQFKLVYPVALFMHTFYGDLPFHIIDTGIGNPIKRYKYDLRSILIKSENSIYLSDGYMREEFRRYNDTQYYVSQKGAIYSTNKKDLLLHSIDGKGYHSTHTHNHRMVYQCWVSDLECGMDIHHLDGQEWNNDASNLQMLTPEEHKLIPNANFKYADEIVHEACRLMETGMRPYDVARKLGIHPQVVVEWRAGARPNISQIYIYPKLGVYKTAKLTCEDVHEICKLLEDEKYTNSEIADMYGVNRYTIQDIRTRSSWRDISENYSFSKEEPGVSRSKSSSPRNATITPEMVRLIWERLRSASTMKEVAEEFGVSYGIVKKIRYQTRWKSVTDKLEPIEKTA